MNTNKKEREECKDGDRRQEKLIATLRERKWAKANTKRNTIGKR
jgi:hypothetical protein